MLKKLALLVVGTVSLFAMHNAEININDKDLELEARLDIGQFNHSLEPDAVFVGARFLKGSVEHGDYDDKKEIESFQEINFLMQREIEKSGLEVGLGLKLNSTKNFVSIPLGVELSYKLPFDLPMPLYLEGSVYYAPEVLSMSDAKSFMEKNINLDVEVIRNGRVTMGFRSIETNYDIGSGMTNDVVYNKSAYCGFKFAF